MEGKQTAIYFLQLKYSIDAYYLCRRVPYNWSRKIIKIKIIKINEAGRYIEILQ